MTTIPEFEEMAFVNWDAAAPPSGHAIDPMLADDIGGPATSAPDPTLDLVFSNIDGDDFSFWALEHFDANRASTDLTADFPAGLDTADFTTAPLGDLDTEPALSQMYWITPERPCVNCSTGGYQCKRIQEGSYKGYCTSCVALRCECSFGPLLDDCTAKGATFPANPWPTMGDRPSTSILLEDDLLHSPEGQAAAGDKKTSPRPQDVPKIGARFSRESVKILKNWVSTHSRHPYPTEEEKEGLQKLTGLNKTQITNWLANARRRGKIHVTRAVSPHIGRGYAQAVDIPGRQEYLNPLERWKHSPPEHEPASVTAIARAVESSGSFSERERDHSGSGRTSPWISNYSDDGSGRSLCNQSSASSWGTSHSSGGSFASAFSHRSGGSQHSIPSFVRSNRGRRRRRRAQPKLGEEVAQTLKTFQCTFCTETFRTKHDWQRHEKSLHLSLERWVCSPEGPTHIDLVTGQVTCVFCGEANPNEAHIESHNFSGCTERTQEERTFYRKDHLRQHLKLVHDVKFLAASMDKWRVNSPEIRSRCGFCGLVLENWSVRVDHLADHYKMGYTMADWKGDWGFDAPVLDMVENAVPPYLIDEERKTPFPFQASQNGPESPSSAYELLETELTYWMSFFEHDQGRAPTLEETRDEACRIIIASEVTSKFNGSHSQSWLRDLIMCSYDAKSSPSFLAARTQRENRLSYLRINGKKDIFEMCEFEHQLQEFVRARLLLGLTAMDPELQVEACKIVGRVEEKTSRPSTPYANFLVGLIQGSTDWLASFRQRAHLPRSEDLADFDRRSKDPKTIDSTVHSYTRLDRELGEYLQSQRSMGQEPTDEALQRQARIIIYDADDQWNQTAADDTCWLTDFRGRYPAPGQSRASSSSGPSPLSHGMHSEGQLSVLGTSSDFVGPLPSQGMLMSCTNRIPTMQKPLGAGPYFLNDANCYRRLFRGLKRFVTQTMSENNPNRHVPTDQEIQHQARWIVYDDDDPWNQTAADNSEWLMRFKRDVGLLSKESGPGLSAHCPDWTPENGGTGFAPPYICPKPGSVIEPSQETLNVVMREEAKRFPANKDTLSRFLNNFTTRYAPPAKVFCSRELESGLTEYVKREVARSGVMPSDAELRQRACDIMSMAKTPCDDPVLLAQFKMMIQQPETNLFGPLDPVDPMNPINTQQADPQTTFFDFDSAIAPPLVSKAGMASAAEPKPIAKLVGEPADEFSFTEQEMSDILDDISPTGSVPNEQETTTAFGTGAGLWF